MATQDRAASTVERAALEGQTAAPLPEELRAELRRLLAAMLVEDMRRYPTLPEADRDGRVTSPSGLAPGEEGEP